jgi:hypothetical protein
VKVQQISTGYTPHKHQAAIHAALKRFSVLVCHRRFGKTVLCVNALLDAALRSKRTNPRYAYIAPTYRQAKKVAWDYVKEFAGAVPGVKFNEVELRVDFSTGARISLYGADNPDSLRGLYLDGTVLDEYADFPQDAWQTVIRPALSDRKGWAVFIGTPRGHNHFYELYQNALREPEWYAARFAASGTDIIDAGELESARRMMTDSQFRQEYECDFDVTGDDILIPLSLVLDSIGRNISHHGMDSVMGVDVGMSLGGDPSAIVVRQGGKVVHLDEFRMDETLKIAGRVRECFHETKPVAVYVDAVGWGAGVAHTLAGWGLPVTAINVAEGSSANDRFVRQRDELWWKGREFFASRLTAIDDGLELRHKFAAELSSPLYGYRPDGKIKVESKDDMKKRGGQSPNIADAFILTMAHADQHLLAGNVQSNWYAEDDAPTKSRFL